MLLSEIKCGESCTVVKINNDAKMKSRLNAIGLVDGVKISVIRKAPFGDPILIKLRDFMLAIRLLDASKITVEML